jgi:hypothetical protein
MAGNVGNRNDVLLMMALFGSVICSRIRSNLSGSAAITHDIDG